MTETQGLFDEREMSWVLRAEVTFPPRREQEKNFSLSFFSMNKFFISDLKF